MFLLDVHMQNVTYELEDTWWLLNYFTATSYMTSIVLDNAAVKC